MSIRCVGSKAVQQQGFAAAGILSVAWSWRRSSSICASFGVPRRPTTRSFCIFLYPKSSSETISDGTTPISDVWGSTSVHSTVIFWCGTRVAPQVESHLVSWCSGGSWLILIIIIFIGSSSLPSLVIPIYNFWSYRMNILRPPYDRIQHVFRLDFSWKVVLLLWSEISNSSVNHGAPGFFGCRGNLGEDLSDWRIFSHENGVIESDFFE